jgi:hypothetical protein
VVTTFIDWLWAITAPENNKEIGTKKAIRFNLMC